MRLSAQEIAWALYGLGRILRLDAQGLRSFNASLGGLWNSFWVAALVLPLDLVQALVAYANAGEAKGGDLGVGPVSYLILELESYVIGWVLFPLVMVWVSTLLDRWPNYFAFLVPYNWFQLVVAAVILPLSILTGIGAVPPEAASFLMLMATAAFLLYTGFIAHKALNVSGFTAFGIVLLDILLSFLVNGTIHQMVTG